MIDLDKNDSQESQVSYRAKNSKEIKHLKNEVKRLRAENASLKSEPKKIEVNQPLNSTKDNSESYYLYLLLLVVLIFPIPLFFSIGDRAMEYKDKYEQCVSSKTVEANHSSILLDEIANSIIKSKHIKLQSEISDKAKLNNISEVVFFGFASPTKSVDLPISEEYESQVSKYITTDDIALHTFDKDNSDKAVSNMVEAQNNIINSYIQYINSVIYNFFVEKNNQ